MWLMKERGADQLEPTCGASYKEKGFYFSFENMKREDWPLSLETTNPTLIFSLKRLSSQIFSCSSSPLNKPPP